MLGVGGILLLRFARRHGGRLARSKTQPDSRSAV
ncbi:MAG: hypothetical protein HRU01_25540 [Myxococcales bacterium]|nr:hypothetical protein [Myxococcales bacterium]